MSAGQRWLLLAILAAAFLPWALFAYQDATGPPGWIPPTPRDAPLKYLEFLFKRPGELKRVLPLLLVAFALVSWRRRGGEPERAAGELPATALVCAWLVVPFAAALVISQVMVPIFTAKNLIISLRAAYLLVSRATLRLPRSPRWGTALGLVLVGVSAFGVLANGRYWREPSREQIREVATALLAEPWDPAKTRLLAYPAQGFDYYLARQGAPRRIDFALSPRPRLEAAAPFLARDASQTLWLLTAHHDAEPDLLRALERDHALVLDKRFFHAWLRRFERR